MYLEQFWTDNLLLGESACGDCCTHSGSVHRWTVLSEADPSRNRLLLKLLALCLGGAKYLPSVVEEIRGYVGDVNRGALFGISLRPDIPRHRDRRAKGIRTGMRPTQLELSPEGETRVSGTGLRERFGATKARRPFSDLDTPMGKFAYGYAPCRGHRRGPGPEPDLAPRARSSRFETLFEEVPELTPVDQWLYRQYLNASRYSSKQAEYVCNVALSAITGWFPELSVSHWAEERVYFKRRAVTCSLSDLDSSYVRTIEFLVDFVRQAADSQTVKPGFELLNGILLVDDMGTLMTGCRPANAMRVLTTLFPNMQYLVSCHDRGLARRIGRVADATLPTSASASSLSQLVAIKSSRAKAKRIRQQKNTFLKTRFEAASRASSKDSVVLVDVDSSIPNLALMKLSQYHKSAGREVILTRDSSPFRDSQCVLASCVFNRSSTERKIQKLRGLHGENLQVGGSGVDLSLRLPEHIESLKPDYSLYPGLDFGLGFLTRGCPRKCDFCIVPRKEGKLRTVAEVDDILAPGQKKLVLLDDNLLASRDVERFLRELKRRDLQVNFNQTLDLQYLTPKKAQLLLELDSRNYTFTRRMYYFSLNSSEQIALVRAKLELLKGLKRSQIMFVCMYGYNTTLSDDLARFSFLAELGVYPFVQQYDPALGNRSPTVPDYFDTDLEPVLSITFRQNGRNFEGFLKWLSRRYAEERGELYMPLVDMIFRYNGRQYKRRYIETLAGLRTRAVEPASGEEIRMRFRGGSQP